MELTQLIKERACVRKFTDKKPSKDQLKAILEAGRLAPSWVNVQPWHFIVVQDPETIKLLGKLSFDQPHVTKAHTLIVCCGTTDSWEDDNYKEIIITRPNITKEKIDFLLNSPTFNPMKISEEAVLMRTTEEVTYAIAYMTLETENQGLACCVIGAIGNPLTKSNLDVYQQVKEKLNLDGTTFIVALLVIVYPDGEKPPKTRKNFDQIVSYNKYKDPF